MARKSSTAAPKAPAKGAAKAAPAAASATAEQLGDQPAGTTDNAAPIASAPPGDSAQTVTEATAALEGGNKGPDAPPVIVLGGPDIAAYLALLQSAGENLDGLIPLSMLNEPQLRQVGQFIEIEGYDGLPPEQLVSLIEAKVGIGAAVAPAQSTGEHFLEGGVVTSASLADSEVPAVLSAGGEPTDTVDDSALDDDGDFEGLWITAVPEQGFRRCGFRFTREGFAIALDALTPAQIEQLENEPNLKVERGIFGGQVEVQ